MVETVELSRTPELDLQIANLDDFEALAKELAGGFIYTYKSPGQQGRVGQEWRYFVGPYGVITGINVKP